MATITVIEDDPSTRTLLEFALRQSGHEVDSARDGASGLDALLRKVPDLVVLDWMLPRLDGVEVCRRARTHPRLDRTPILFLTARTEAGSVSGAFGAGADDYLAKPFKRGDLLVHIESLLRDGRRQPAVPS